MNNDGGPAFPTAMPGGASKDVPLALRGMSLRDYYAGQVVASQCWSEIEGSSFEELSEQNFKYADAMLAEREKGP